MINCLKELIVELFDSKINVLNTDLEKAVKAGMGTSIIYDELDELENLKLDILDLFDELDGRGSKRFMVDDAGSLIDMETRECYDSFEEIANWLNGVDYSP